MISLPIEDAVTILDPFQDSRKGRPFQCFYHTWTYNKKQSFWARMIPQALIAKNRYRFDDRTVLVSPVIDSHNLSWERCNNLVHSWIVNFIFPSIGERLVFVKNVKSDLKEWFSQEIWFVLYVESYLHLSYLM